MIKIISLVKPGKKLTPYLFYSEFLKEIAFVYSESNENRVEYKLIHSIDLNVRQNQFYIDPITLPLLLSLTQQLKNYQNEPIKFHLSYVPDAMNLLEFLFLADFFKVVGKNTDKNNGFGLNLLEFDSTFLGGFKNKLIRSEHKIRYYSLLHDNLLERINRIIDEPSKRDFLVEYYTFKTKEHFYSLLFENESVEKLTSEFIEILAELITNGVLHSESDAFVLMFSDRYKTKFSISDNGIGLYESLKKKDNTNEFYKKFELLEFLSKVFPLEVSDKIKISILSLFETLFYSMLKDRQGLFDLMCNVVLNCGGYFRLHTENAQIIVSARMLNELLKLNITRNEILKTYNLRLFELIDKKELENRMISLVKKCKGELVDLANSIFKKYTEDTKFSSIRIFEVKFKGVHIEVEIPNNIQKS